MIQKVAAVGSDYDARFRASQAKKKHKKKRKCAAPMENFELVDLGPFAKHRNSHGKCNKKVGLGVAMRNQVPTWQPGGEKNLPVHTCAGCPNEVARKRQEQGQASNAMYDSVGTEIVTKPTKAKGR